MVVLIVLAECFSCTGTITTNSLWFTLEEGSWIVSFTLVTPCAFVLSWRCLQLRKLAKSDLAWTSARVFSFGLLLCCIAYVPWGWASDVPNNLARYRHETARHQHYMSFKDGLNDAACHWVVSRDWDVWKPYLLWMSAYFTAGVWSSISLCFAPRIRRWNAYDDEATFDPLLPAGIQ
mmetsp:Transcript_21774/g.51172  ORF Transcript_21774/g.51172 Transcript_21774/m.51172 type:complete len:177 (+) Transcript_21774:41-571(+)